VEQLRGARQRGSQVTASIPIANLVATDDCLRSFHPNWKVRPPLRAQHHVDACIAGLKDGTIDIITSGHAPRAAEKKMRELDLAPFGAIGLETTLAMLVTKMIDRGILDWPTVVAKVSTNPARLLRQSNKGTLRLGADADLTIIDPRREWVIDVDAFQSKARNCPYHGQAVRGSAHTIVGGRMSAGPRSSPSPFNSNRTL
jgi:dihydroorotase